MTGGERERLLRLKPHLQRRAEILECTRAFFRERGFLETETPIRVPTVAPESEITPLRSEDWFLSTSPELHMKRLLAAGYERLFQISRCFRKGERGRWHNPEFTMLEWYGAGADYKQMVSDMEQLLVALANKLGPGLVLSYQGRQIDLTPPWPRVTVREAFRHAAGWDPVACPDALRFDTEMVTKVIPSLRPDCPTVLLDYPAAMASLARLKSDDPRVAERVEVFVGLLELANAYSELTDAREQERRFRAQAEQIEQQQGITIAMPERFLGAVAHLPECGGIALGMDRLAMLFCDAASIDEVNAFNADTA